MTTYRIALVGCGGIANLWMNKVLQRSDASIVALIDVREESAIAMAEKYGLSCPTFTDLKTAIDATDANLVLDITIPSVHYEIRRTAMLNGCDVLGEKPMAETMETGVEITSAQGQAMTSSVNAR